MVVLCTYGSNRIQQTQMNEEDMGKRYKRDNEILKRRKVEDVIK